MDKYCVSCGKELYTESGSLLCRECTKKSLEQPILPVLIEDDWSYGDNRPNTELSFGANDGQYDFLVRYHRAKPLNRFQIWMYKVCFGIRARNV